MRLVRDLVDSRIVFYWIDESDKRVSPDHPTFRHAQEWWKHFMFSRYEGEERRHSIIDRRSDIEKRARIEAQKGESILNVYGRRTTDIPLDVDIDLAAEKLKSLHQV